MTATAVAEHNMTSGRPIVLYYGVQASDATDYPDCHPAFIKVAEQAIAQSTNQYEISVEAPLLIRLKEEVLALGQELGVNYEQTFSCYND